MKSFFKIVVLGCSGGPFDRNLSCFLLAPSQSNDYIALDAGSLLSGIEIAFKNGCFFDVPLDDAELTPVGKFFLEHVKAYLITHAHLDHVAGLVVNSPVDRSKPILGTDETINNLQNHLFNGKIWAQWTEEEDSSHKKFHYHRLKLNDNSPIPGTQMKVETFLLSHPGEKPSSAFLIEFQGAYVLYFGDTSSDFKEKEKNLGKIWKRIAPLLQKKQLKGLLIECSFPNALENETTYGHLDSNLLIKEMEFLQQISQTSLRDFPVIITHIKDSLTKNNPNKAQIQKELQASSLGIQWIFPIQGQRIEL